MARYLLETPVFVGDKNRLVLGERCAIGNTVFNLASGDICIGNRTIFGSGCMLITGTHTFVGGKRVSVWPQYDDGSWGGGTKEVDSSGRDITVGEGVFVGARVIILGPAKIGDHSLVAAGSVVTRDFDAFSIIAGVPAVKIGDTRFTLSKSVRKNFNED